MKFKEHFTQVCHNIWLYVLHVHNFKQIMINLAYTNFNVTKKMRFPHPAPLVGLQYILVEKTFFSVHLYRKYQYMTKPVQYNTKRYKQHCSFIYLLLIKS